MENDEKLPVLIRSQWYQPKVKTYWYDLNSSPNYMDCLSIMNLEFNFRQNILLKSKYHFQHSSMPWLASTSIFHKNKILSSKCLLILSVGILQLGVALYGFFRNRKDKSVLFILEMDTVRLGCNHLLCANLEPQWYNNPSTQQFRTFTSWCKLKLEKVKNCTFSCDQSVAVFSSATPNKSFYLKVGKYR